MTTRTRRIVRRTLTTALIALGLTAGPALAATAAPSASVATSVSAAGPVAAKACADAPEPTRPSAGLQGKLFSKPATATNADPFTNPRVPISDVYGYSYKWNNYDTGCLAIAGATSSASTRLNNIGLASASSLVGFSHGLLSLVVVPEWLGPLDSVLTSATSAVKDGFWTPWALLVLVLVGVVVLWAANRSDLPGVVTSTGWAVLALVATTYVMSYPVSSAQAVDGLIQETVTISAKAAGATAPGEGEILGPPVPGEKAKSSGSPAADALNSMFDSINRDTLYTGWLEGVFGSSTSEVATKYGPDLFRASHLTWDEAEKVDSDPAGEGKQIVDAKKALWVKTAAAVERTDSYAYKILTGQTDDRWGASITALLTTAAIVPFLIVAGIFIVLAYGVTRVFVPLSPAIGVIALLHLAEGWVMGVLKNVGRFIVLGPLFWVAALVNLAIASAVWRSELEFILKLAISLAVPIILFKLLRPGQSIPGLSRMRRLMRMGTGAMFTRRAVRKGVNDANEKNGSDDEDDSYYPPDRSPRPYRRYYPKDAPVADTPIPTRTLTSSPSRRELEAMPQGSAPSRADQAPAALGAPRTSGGRELDAAPRRRRGLPPSYAPGTLSRGRTANALEPGAENGSVEPGAGPVAGERALAGGGRHPATSSDDYRPMTPRTLPGHETSAPAEEENLSAPAPTTPPATIMRHSDPLPSGIVEANSRTVDGGQVFEIWQPPSMAKQNRSDDEEYR